MTLNEFVANQRTYLNLGMKVDFKMLIENQNKLKYIIACIKLYLSVL